MRCVAAGLLLALAAWTGGAAAQAPRTATLMLPEGSPAIEAQALASMWVDPAGTATIAQVAQLAPRFRPNTTDAIHGFSPSGALWLHYRLQRSREDRHGWVIAFPAPALDTVNVWQQDARGQWQVQTAGDTTATANWPEAGRYAAFRLDLPPGQPRDIYVQVRSVSPTSVPVRLAADSVHDQHIQVEYLALGMAFGALLLLIAACLVQSWVYRDLIYAWYAGYAATTMVAVMAYTGVAAHLLWTGSGFWADASQGSLAALAAGTAMMFVRSLTGISARHKWLDRVALVGGPAGVLLALAYPAIPRTTGLPIMALYVAFVAFTNILVAWLSWRRRDSVGLWVLVAYVPLTFAVLLALGRLFGLLPVSFVTQYAIVLAMAAEVPLLLVALSIRSRERHGAQIRALALSSQDALTGLLAAHLFHDRLRQVVTRYKRDKEHAAVVYIDLVNYNRIKDHYGSAVAEQSLLRSVIKLRRLLRDVDTVGRVGEARFGLIMEGVSSRIAVTDRAARLIAAGLMPLQGLKPEVTLHFHIAGSLLAERTLEARELEDALAALLASMSSRTRRPIRFVEPEVTQPSPLDAMDSLHETDEDSQLPEPQPARGLAA